jgi:hypothetical protein
MKLNYIAFEDCFDDKGRLAMSDDVWLYSYYFGLSPMFEIYLLQRFVSYLRICLRVILKEYLFFVSLFSFLKEMRHACDSHHAVRACVCVCSLGHFNQLTDFYILDMRVKPLETTRTTSGSLITTWRKHELVRLEGKQRHLMGYRAMKLCIVRVSENIRIILI